MSLDSLIVSESARSFLEEATARYEQSIDQQAASYLQGRGLTREAALFARLGRASDPLPGHEHFRDMLCIPFVTPSGVVALKFRCLSDHDCKEHGHLRYNAPAGQKIRLFNVRALHEQSDVIAVCEGELDALLMHQVVGIPAVGTWGTNWHDYYPRIFSDYERVLVIADNDVKPDGSNPGEKHAKKVAASLHGAEVILPPAGCDLTDWFLKEGAEAVREACGL